MSTDPTTQRTPVLKTAALNQTQAYITSVTVPLPEGRQTAAGEESSLKSLEEAHKGQRPPSLRVNEKGEFKMVLPVAGEHFLEFPLDHPASQHFLLQQSGPISLMGEDGRPKGQVDLQRDPNNNNLKISVTMNGDPASKESWLEKIALILIKALLVMLGIDPSKVQFNGQPLEQTAGRTVNITLPSSAVSPKQGEPTEAKSDQPAPPPSSAHRNFIATRTENGDIRIRAINIKGNNTVMEFKDDAAHRPMVEALGLEKLSEVGANANAGAGTNEQSQAMTISLTVNKPGTSSNKDNQQDENEENVHTFIQKQIQDFLEKTGLLHQVPGLASAIGDHFQGLQENTPSTPRT